MARRQRGHAGLGLVAGACLLALLGAGCSPADPPPAPPTTSSPTPTENAQEREQRLAYEAAEKSYREFRAEYYRVLSEGGSKSATTGMKQTAAGPALKEATEVVQAFNGLKRHSSGSSVVSDVQGEGYASDELVLRACEDSSKVTYFDSKGRKTGVGEIRLVDLRVRRTAEQWKVWTGSGKKVESCGN